MHLKHARLPISPPGLKFAFSFSLILAKLQELILKFVPDSRKSQAGDNCLSISDK